jgi:predicted unusual protein kinase regulating ubiquinone biosynthesis (AarF/ABC1/UbiB family)
MCTQTVIVSEYIDAESMLDFISRSSQDAVDHIANQLFAFHTLAFMGGRVYVDYHWGNMKVLGGDKLVMLDFGMCETVSDKARDEFKVLSKFAVDENKSAFINAMKMFGYDDGKYSESFYSVYEVFAQSRRSPGFKFTQAYQDEMNRVIKDAVIGEMHDGALCVMRAEVLLIHVIVYMNANPDVYGLDEVFRNCKV